MTASPAHAGAWLQKERHGTLTHQLTYYSSDRFFNQRGDKTAQPRFNKLEYQPHVEYGLTRRYTIGGTAYLQRNWQGGATNTGIADPEIFLRARLYHDDAQVLSLQPLVKLPSIFLHDSKTPRGGSHTTDAELSLLYGRNLNLVSARDYIDTRIGYRARSRGLNHQYRADVAVGLSPCPDWHIIPAVRYTKATRLVGDKPFRQTGETDYDLLKADLAIAYHLNDAESLQASYTHDIDGKQTGAGQGVSVAYAVTF